MSTWPSPLASRWLRAAAAYLLIGLALGLHMAMTHDHRPQTVHVHAHLLGWVSMGLCGLLHAVIPALGESRWAAVHYGLHQLGLPTMLVSLAALRHGVRAAEAGAAVGGSMVTVGLACFAARLVVATRARSSPGPSGSGPAVAGGAGGRP